MRRVSLWHSPVCSGRNLPPDPRPVLGRNREIDPSFLSGGEPSHNKNIYHGPVRPYIAPSLSILVSLCFPRSLPTAVLFQTLIFGDNEEGDWRNSRRTHRERVLWTALGTIIWRAGDGHTGMGSGGTNQPIGRWVHWLYSQETAQMKTR